MTDSKPHYIYRVTIRADDIIPPQILAEHLIHSLEDFKETKTEVGVMHPFEDKSNVLFDDDVKTEEYTGPVPPPKIDPKAHITVQDPYPLTTRVIDYLKGRKRD